MLKKIMDTLWEDLYYEGEKFINERECGHLHNMKSISKTIYYISQIDKLKEGK